MRFVTTGLAIATVAAVLCAPAHAYQVVAFPDVDTSPQGCALRGAIETLRTDTNVDACVLAGSPGNDEILLVQGVHTFPILLNGNTDDVNASGDFDIRENLTITGDGTANSTIDGQQRDRVFDVQNGATLTLRHLTVTGGKAPNGALNSGNPGAKGGGIRAGSATSGLVLNDVVVTGNNAGNGGSGTNGSPGTNGGQGGDGGGIYAVPFITVTNSVISGNAAGNGASGGSAPSCITVTTGGTGGFGGFGGGIEADNGAEITGSTITANMTGQGGPGGCAATPGTGGHGGSGGGISGQALTITNSIISDNQTRIGGLAGQDGDSANNGVSGRGGDGGGIYGFNGATISGSTISGNLTGAGAGNALGVGQNSPGREGGDGGGALLESGGSITNSTFSGNHTGNGGSSTGSFGNQGGRGGALAITDPDPFAGFGYTISNSTFTGNFTGNGGNSPTQPGAGGAGGAVFFEGHSAERTVSMSDSTLTDNHTGTGGNHTNNGTGGAGGFGGAIGVGDFGTIGLTHLTVAANQTGAGGTGTTAGTQPDGGGIEISGPFNPSTVTVKNSILASNTPATCAVTSSTLTDGGHNLVFGTQCTDITAASTADPQLGALADNGGPTLTMALPSGSPAQNLVPSTGAGCTATDQRGTTRPQGSACDAGAFELFVAPPTPPPSGGSNNGGGGTPSTENPQPQGPEPLAKDTQPPTVKLLLTKQKLLKALKKGYICTFSTTELGSATASFGRSAKGKLTIKKVGKNRFVLKFTKKAKKALAKKKKVKLKLKLVVKDAAGNATTKTARVTLKR